MYQTIYPRCLICGSPWDSFETPKDQKKYYRCTRCGYMHLFPEFYPSPSEERARYLEHNNSLENRGYAAHLNEIIEGWILPRQDTVAQILDYGSGPVPVFAALLKKKGFQPSLFDTFFAPEHENLGKFYEMVTLIEVIEHLEDPLPVLKKLKSLLSPGGSILLTTLLFTGKTDFHSWWYRMDSTHRGFFTEDTFAFIAEYLSFSDCSVSGNRIILLTK